MTRARTSGSQPETTAVTEAPDRDGATGAPHRVNGNGAAPAAPAETAAPQRTAAPEHVDTTKPPPATPPPARARPAQAKPAAAESDNSWIVPLAVLIVGMFMSVLDTSIVNV